MPVVTNEPRSKGGFALGDYVEVKDRIRMFYDRFPDGRLVTDRAEYWLELDPPRIVVKALAYRTADDPHPGVGWSWLEMPGKTPYTKGSELENAETSAWGRAIGAVGIGLEKGVGTGDEIRSHQDDGSEAGAENGLVDQRREPDGLIGILSVSGTQDFNLRQTPTGYVLPFRVKEGNRAGQIVQAEGELATQLDTAAQMYPVIGKRVTVWGTYTDETFDKKVDGDLKKIPYRLLHLTRIQTPEFILPAPVRAEAEPVAMGLV